jgi:hypothetical protein
MLIATSETWFMAAEAERVAADEHSAVQGEHSAMVPAAPERVAAADLEACSIGRWYDALRRRSIKRVLLPWASVRGRR